MFKWPTVEKEHHTPVTPKAPPKRDTLPVKSDRSSKIGITFPKGINISKYMSLMTSVTTAAEKLGVSIGSVLSHGGASGDNIKIVLTPTESENIGTGINTISASEISRALQEVVNEQCHGMDG